MRGPIARVLALALAGAMPAACSVAGRGAREVVDVSCDDGAAAVCWPRFPPQGAARVLPRLAVFLSMGEINQNTTLARLGYPDRLLFRLHRDMPRLKVVVIGSPANRYSSDRDVAHSPEGAFTWKALGVGSRFDWIEIGGAGYTHSPPDDTSLDHHEFAPEETGCNLDHARMADPAYCVQRLRLARDAYAQIGIPQDRIVLIRFPGLRDTPAALRAASETGFLAVLSNRHPDDAGRPHWLEHPGGEILDLENTKLADLFMGGEGGPRPAMHRIQRLIDGGGILNLRTDLQQLFLEDGKPTPDYHLLEQVLRQTDERYGAEVWYPAGRDLALWLDLRRHARMTVSADAGAIEVRIVPPEAWRAAGRSLQTAALAVRLPDGWKDVAGVTLGEDGGPPPAAVPAARWFLDSPRRLVVQFAVGGPIRLRVVGG